MAESFLISRLSSLGDVACSLPAACALKAAYPESRVVWLVDPRFRAVVDACEAIDEVIAQKPSWKRPIEELKGRRFDAAFDLQGLFKSAWPISKANAEVKLGYHWQREGSWLFTRPVLPDTSSLHVVDQYVDVVRAFGAQDVSRAEFQLKPNAIAVQDIEELLPSWLANQKLVVVNAGAAWATKRWPPASFAQVIDRLADQGVPCVLIGSNATADKSAAEEAKSQCASVPIDLLGKTTIAQLIALIDRSSAHLGGDTGSTHIAAALDKPAIGLYSITRPERSCPYRQRHRTHYNRQSLSAIQPDPVFQSIIEALA